MASLLSNRMRRCGSQLLKGSSLTQTFGTNKLLRYNTHNIQNRFGSSSTTDTELPERDRLDFDVAIVGGGPAGLATAIRLKQLCQQNDTNLEVAVIEKGAEIGSHIVSGNVFNPVAFNELFPNWKELDPPPPLTTTVKDDQFWLMTETSHIKSPFLPPMMRNDGNYIISLGDLCRWLGEQAELMDINILPGFSASEPIYNESNNAVIGIGISDVGLNKDGTPGINYERGVGIHAKQIVLAEGCRGSLSEDIIDHFNLRSKSEQQLYAIGFKEVWELPSDFDQYRDISAPGTVIHMLGYPIPSDIYGGSFWYHTESNEIYLGCVLSLEYENPYLNPYQEFQKLKKHPSLAKILSNGKCTGYGARALNEGGYQSVPKLTFPGGLIAGCSAGFVNVPKVKGTHYAMKSGILAAESIYNGLINDSADLSEIENEEYEINNPNSMELKDYEENIHNSYVINDLKQVRNVKPSFKFGRIPGLFHSALTTTITKGNEPWTLNHGDKSCADHTKPKSEFEEIKYDKPDNKLTFDILTSVSRTGTYHEDNEPSHLIVKEGLENIANNESWDVYGGPESRFCPARVYEFVDNGNGKMELVINSQNCIHCKTCSIKTPKEYIKWTVPQGGGGPKYASM